MKFWKLACSNLEQDEITPCSKIDKALFLQIRKNITAKRTFSGNRGCMQPRPVFVEKSRGGSKNAEFLGRCSRFTVCEEYAWKRTA